MDKCDKWTSAKRMPEAQTVRGNDPSAYAKSEHAIMRGPMEGKPARRKLASAGRLLKMEARFNCNHHQRKLVAVAAEHLAVLGDTPTALP